jgi:glutamate--cysteine ligase/energy-coupling factor transport system ATP-binding protein
MAPRRYPYPLSTRLLLRAARGIGIRARILDRSTGYLVELRRRDRRHLAYQHILPLNHLAAARIAADKAHTRAILAREGVRIPEGRLFFRRGFFRKVDYAAGRDLKAALEYARALRYPLYVKPNTLSQGLGVQRVASPSELRAAVRAIFELPTEREYAFLVERPISGVDLRIVTLDGAPLLAIERRPPVLIGDGRSSLARLIRRWRVQARRRGWIEPTAAAWRRTLHGQGLRLGDRLRRGAEAILDDSAANLSRGGRARLVALARLDPRLLAQAVAIAGRLDLRYAGIDFKLPAVSAPAELATLLEVNSAPALSRLYELGFARAVLITYRRLLRAVFQP